MKHSRRLTRFIPLGVALAVMTLGGISASAQSGSGDFLEPPSITPARRPDNPFMRYAGAFLVIFAVVGANLIPSKRGHQD